MSRFRMRIIALCVGCILSIAAADVGAAPSESRPASEQKASPQQRAIEHYNTY